MSRPLTTERIWCVSAGAGTEKVPTAVLALGLQQPIISVIECSPD